MVCVSFREAESERSNKTGHYPEDCMEQRAQNAKVKGSWHDHRHTMITDLAESGAGDQTKMDIAGHVSKNMFKHYSHIRMEAKREALESIVKRPATTKPLPKGSRNSKVA